MNNFSFINTEGLDEFAKSALEEAILKAQDLLKAIASDNDFAQKVTIAFGNEFDIDTLENLRQQWEEENFESFPPIEIRPSAEINGANGAFSADTNTIYLAREYIAQNASNSQAIIDVVLEEYGHFVDAQINEVDAPGDESNIFSALVRGIELDEAAIQKLKAEDDTAIVRLDGQVIQIEQAENIEQTENITISGTIKWKDDNGTEHAVREANLLVTITEPTEPNQRPKFNEKELITEPGNKTTENGDYLISINKSQITPNKQLVIWIVADGPHHDVRNTSAKDIYTYPNSLLTNEIDLSRPHKIVIPKPDGSEPETAFSISDALYIAGKFAEDVRGTPPSNVRLSFPNGIVEPLSPETIPFYNSETDTINLPLRYRLAWDVIHHEYGHHLASLDNLSTTPSPVPPFLEVDLNHSFGVSNIG
ncbi:MAG: hypothetical protein F6J86_39340, partial [Symploca sp. SIO1B1]|nr:hypothetical protein [Symploca sp. SIO1B1]